MYFPYYFNFPLFFTGIFLVNIISHKWDAYTVEIYMFSSLSSANTGFFLSSFPLP
jgi:hypothetical protein